MPQKLPQKFLLAAAAMVILWLLAGYLFPLALPFMLGLGLAVAAEPMVRLLTAKTRLPRSAATAISVSAVCALSVAALILLLALLIRQIRSLHSILPQLEDAVQQGLQALSLYSSRLAAKLPGNIAAVVTGLLDDLFSDSTMLFQQAAARLPRIAGGLLSDASEGLLAIVTGIISGFMISGRLPQLKSWILQHTPACWAEKYTPAIRALRLSIRGWIAAEVKLAGVAWVLLSVGFLLLRIPKGLLWAALITIVDAFPVLGVGTVMLPWSLICLLQGNTVRGIGLLGLYAVIWLVRSVLEPKLVGKGIGLDPLITLAAIYIGLQLWGIVGMLLAPILALTAVQIVKQAQR